METVVDNDHSYGGATSESDSEDGLVLSYEQMAMKRRAENKMMLHKIMVYTLQWVNYR